VTDTIQVQVAAATCDRCPVTALSERTTLRAVRVDPDDARVDFVADDSPADAPSELDLLEFAGRAHGRYELGRGGADREPRDGGDEGDGERGDHDPSDPDATSTPSDGGCTACACAGLPSAFSGFPVSPRETLIDEGELLATFVLTGYGELQAIVDAFGGAEVRRILVDRDTNDGRPDVVPVDLSDVTERQATVAAVAVEKGYFGPDGATADEIAAELGVAKSTVSEHLRLVTASVLSQLFGEGI